MLAFPILAIAIALIAIGRGGGKQYFDERPRDRVARRMLFYLGIVVLVASLGAWFI